LDSITHIALGAVVGEALLGKSIGKRAMVFGAIAQSLPDVDFMAAFWMTTTENILAHRGFTHSFLFMAVTTVLLGYLAWRWHRDKTIPLTTWMLFFAFQITIHLLIDACNAYGVGWFEPFSHHRISFNILFVADPFFSISTGIAALVLVFMNSENRLRSLWVVASLTVSSLYIIYAVYNKVTIDKAVDNSLKEQKITHHGFFSTPTPLNNWLWFVAAKTDSGFQIGHRSVFENQTKIEFYYFPQNKSALDTLKNHEDIQRLIRFSQGYYTVENRNDTLLFNDLRFGQITGWATPTEKFVFHYYLEYPEENQLVIQRGRFANWNSETVNVMIEKIWGSKK